MHSDPSLGLMLVNLVPAPFLLPILTGLATVNLMTGSY